jgi:hypothetical protein
MGQYGWMARGTQELEGGLTQPFWAGRAGIAITW